VLDPCFRELVARREARLSGSDHHDVRALDHGAEGYPMPPAFGRATRGISFCP
jgi:hypothetical protein